MKLPTVQRLAWLKEVAELTSKLGRPPFVREVAKARNSMPNASHLTTRLAIRDGQVEDLMLGGVGRLVKLTVPCKLHLRVPVLVYLATARISAWQDHMIRLGLDWVAAPWNSTDRNMLARRCDAVLVIGDRLRLGHPDVVGAAGAGVPVSLISPDEIAAIDSPDLLWLPPFEQPRATQVIHSRWKALDD